MEETELAERPREGESWTEMIERQRNERGNVGGNARELLRSLPDEQRQDKPRGRSELPDLVAENASYESMLREASQRGGAGQDRGIDR